MRAFSSEEIAHIAHDAYRAYSEIIGEVAIPEWNYLLKSDQDKLIRGVNALIDNPKLTPGDLHEKWLKKKRVRGWVFAEVLDEHEKKSPLILPFDSLTPEQQFKDKLFRRVCSAFIDIEIFSIITPLEVKKK